MHAFTTLLLIASATFAICSSISSATLKGSLSALGINASFPGAASYPSTSCAFNLRFTFKPAAVTFPKSPQEVAEIVKIGVAQRLTVVARSGGHSYIADGLGGKDGALVVDLQNLDQVTVDSSRGTAVIESGNRLGDIALVLGKEGRALPHGICPYVGIGVMPRMADSASLLACGVLLLTPLRPSTPSWRTARLRA